MKIALVCPSNMLYMPYVGNYTIILNEVGIDYDIIYWDRFIIEEQSEFVYRDLKVGHQRGFLNYFKYCRFVLNHLKKKSYDKIIVFGIQLVFFIKRFLVREYRNKFIIDIRDYNRIIKYFNIKKVIDNSAFTVLSSPGFKEWLPKNNKYIINHNTQVISEKLLYNVNNNLNNKKRININYIGSIRDYKLNIDFINALKNNERIKLYFHGEGLINKDIEEYLNKNNIKNVRLTGKYEREEEPDLYIKTDLVNVLIPNDSINSRTLLPNRLYNAAIYGKPILAFEGTYLSKIIKEYNLGLVISSFQNIEDMIVDYFDKFSNIVYEKGRQLFFENVLKENMEFRGRLAEFLTRRQL